MFLQKKSMADKLEAQEKVQEKGRKILKQVIDTAIFLGKQKFRGHRESLANEPSVNTGKFLEILKHVAHYDDVITAHLEKVENDHREMEEKKKGIKKGDKIRHFGRGSNLTFVSNNIQNKLIDITAVKIALEIVN